MSLINKEKLESEMYHNAFEIDTDLQKWDSGCWIRYKMFENVIEEQPEVKAIPLDKPFCKMVYGDYVCYNRKWLMKHLQMELDILQGKAIPIEWIKRYIAEEGIYPNRELLSVEQADAIERMIYDWEKENEANAEH